MTMYEAPTTDIKCSTTVSIAPPIIRAEEELTLNTVFAGRALKKLKRLVYDFAKSKQNLFFVGERGTGKEILADIYAEASGRKKYPLNCSGISKALANSKLFGHVQGAFTGANEDHDGLFRIASGNFVFLDELGASSPNMQAQLLRILETGDYQPLGSNKTEEIDNVAVCAATSTPEDVRDDLKDRFMTLYIPPLRARLEDVPEIFKELWKEECEESETAKKIIYVSNSALNLLKCHSWPGNVRELKKMMQIAIVLAKFDRSNTIRVTHLPTLDNDKPDRSRKVKISGLKGAGDPLLRKTFFQPFKSLSSTEKQFPTDPETYKKRFYDYYGNYSPAELKKLYPEAKYDTLKTRLKASKLNKSV